MSAKRLTTYLGSLLSEAGVDIPTLPYDGKQVDYSAHPNLNPKAILGRYEAGLTQATYMSRLCYTANIRKMCGVNLINYNPLVFNTAMSLMRRNLSLFDEKNGATLIAAPYVGDAVILYDKTKTHETPCYFQMIDYTNYQGPSPYPGERILYMTFRGTLSLKSAFLTDANVTTAFVGDLLERCVMEGKTGLDAFEEDILNLEAYRLIQGINPFGAHQGFLLNLKGIMDKACNTLQTLLETHKPTRLIITGHSLGAANATLASLVIAGFKRAKVECLQSVKIHCITFGAPKLFLDYTRNVYNRLLDHGILTLDRIANRMENLAVGLASAGVALNLVPTIPPNLVHPGYMILKHEIKTQSRTGRSKNITDLREMFGSLGRQDTKFYNLLGKMKSYSEFNGLPYYPEYLACFEPVGTENYEKSMNLPFGTLYPVPGAENKVYNIVKSIVKIIVGKEIADTDSKKDEQDAQQDEQLSLDPRQVQKNANIVNNMVGPNAVAPSEVQPLNQTGGFSLVSKAKQEYEAATLQNGPNHIVYNCKKNINPFTCHLAYLGVGFGGLSAGDLGYSPPPESTFQILQDNLTNTRRIQYGIKITGGRRRKRSTKTSKAPRMHRRQTRKHQ